MSSSAKPSASNVELSRTNGGGSPAAAAAAAPDSDPRVESLRAPDIDPRVERLSDRDSDPRVERLSDPRVERLHAPHIDPRVERRTSSDREQRNTAARVSSINSEVSTHASPLSQSSEELSGACVVQSSQSGSVLLTEVAHQSDDENDIVMRRSRVSMADTESSSSVGSKSLPTEGTVAPISPRCTSAGTNFRSFPVTEARVRTGNDFGQSCVSVAEASLTPILTKSLAVEGTTVVPTSLQRISASGNISDFPVTESDAVTQSQERGFVDQFENNDTVKRHTSSSCVSASTTETPSASKSDDGPPSHAAPSDSTKRHMSSSTSSSAETDSVASTVTPLPKRQLLILCMIQLTESTLLSQVLYAYETHDLVLPFRSSFCLF